MSSDPMSYATPRPGRTQRRTRPMPTDVTDGADDFVIITKDACMDMPESRPSYGGESDMGESNMSHDPLIASHVPSSHHERQTDAERRLLTINKLNPVERSALVRQTRKIHKLLGETPQIAEKIDTQLPSRAPNKLQRRPTLAGSDIRMDRSAATAAIESPRLEPPPGSNWGRIGSSLVATSPAFGANANVPLLKLNVVPSTGENMVPVRVRRLSDSSVASSSINSILNVRQGSGEKAQESGSTVDLNSNSVSRPKRGSSNGIYVPPSPTSPLSTSAAIQRQQGRARMAKLQQIMGEPIPSELVMGTLLNEPRRRRLSMESPLSPATPAQTLKHKRSRSMWRKDMREVTEFDSAPEASRPSKGHSKSKSRNIPPIEDLLLKQLQTPMTDKQKALNVKRALKMAAVFGVPPPQSLYQDQTRMQYNPSFDSVASRQSLANLAFMIDHDRDSLYDILANATDSGSDSEEDPVDWPYEHKPRSGTLPDRSAPKGATKHTIAGRYPDDMVPPTPPFRGSFEEKGGEQRGAVLSRPLPLTIHSTSTSVSIGKDGVAKAKNAKISTPKGSFADAQFSVRRRRANKLSRFFGVGYNDLWNALIYSEDPQFSTATVPPVPALPGASPLAPKAGPSSSNASRTNLVVPSNGLSRSGTVVQTDTGKATVLRTSANFAADIDAEDLGEVMDRLRALKA